MGYKEKINPRFYEITVDYINSLSEFTYKMDFYALKAKKSYYRYMVDRCRFGIDHYTHSKIKIANMRDCFFIHPTKEEFSFKTKKYFNDLFAPFFTEGVETIILDQAVMPRDAAVIDRYFENAKMIIVERDPRDMFCNEFHVKTHGVTSTIVNTVEAGVNFAKLQIALRSDIPVSNNILRIRFEDLILDYDATVATIENFLDINSADHKLIKKYLKPEVSRKNIGIWKKFYDKFYLAIDAIRTEMPKDLYD